MVAIIYCLVDTDGKVHVKPDAESYAEVAREFGLNRQKCYEYRFDLVTRRFLVDRGSPSSALAVQEYVDNQVGSAERLMTFAGEGYLSKRVLAELLSIEQRQRYLDACAHIERRYTEACTARNDPCLESGCSVEGEDEICLQPILNAGPEYQHACGAEWLKRFRMPVNRIDAWKN
jgi:hypothetical protein